MVRLTNKLIILIAVLIIAFVAYSATITKYDRVTEDILAGKYASFFENNNGQIVNEFISLPTVNPNGRINSFLEHIDDHQAVTLHYSAYDRLRRVEDTLIMRIEMDIVKEGLFPTYRIKDLLNIEVDESKLAELLKTH